MPNANHVRRVLHSMDQTNCKPALTPSVAGSVKQKRDDGADLDMQECRLHRGIVGSLPYESTDRCDVQFETNACAKELKRPTRASWTRLKQLARCLTERKSARIVLVKPGDYDPHEAFLRDRSDSDCAGNVKDRSQYRLKIEVDGCPLCSAPRKKATMLIRENIVVHGLDVRTEFLLDSAAARGICRREDVGTMRHLSTKVLWLQQLVKRGAGHGWSMYIRREPHRLGDEATNCCIAAAGAMELSGVGPRRRMNKTRMSSAELQRKQSLILDKETEESWKHQSAFRGRDEVSIWSDVRCNVRRG